MATEQKRIFLYAKGVGTRAGDASGKRRRGKEKLKELMQKKGSLYSERRGKIEGDVLTTLQKGGEEKEKASPK